jgi:hypothetical protein
LWDLVKLLSQFGIQSGSVIHLKGVIVNCGFTMNICEVRYFRNLERSCSINQHKQSELGSAANASEDILVEEEVCTEKDN